MRRTFTLQLRRRIHPIVVHPTPLDIALGGRVLTCNPCSRSGNEVQLDVKHHNVQVTPAVQVSVDGATFEAKATITGFGRGPATYGYASGTVWADCPRCGSSFEYSVHEGDAPILESMSMPMTFEIRR